MQLGSRRSKERIFERITELIVDVPVVGQHQVLRVQKERMTHVAPQSQFINDVAREAEKYRDEHEADKAKINAKSRLEKY